jgi:hypothetical protein
LVDEQCDLHPVLRAGLCEDPRYVRLDCRLARVHRCGDGGVRAARGSGVGDLALALGQLPEATARLCCARLVSAATDPFDHPFASPTPIDPTITVSGTYLLYGTVPRLIEALFLAAFTYTVTRTRTLPRWAAVSAGVLALVNLAFVPSLYFGNDPANFYAANGWGTTATMGGLFMLWMLATSIAVLRATIPSSQDRRGRALGLSEQR